MMDLSRAENAARRLLAQQGVNVVPVPVENLIKRLGIELVYYELEDDVSGMLIRRDVVKAVIGVNVKHHLNRQRFTIAHELAHFVLHKSDATVFIDDYMVHFRSEAKSRKTDPKELEANHFAGALLMPAVQLKNDLKLKPIDVSDEDAIRGLARKYLVSAQALTVRLMRLNLLAS